MTPAITSGITLAQRHAGRFRIVSYAELRAKSTEVAEMILAKYAGDGKGIVIAPILGGGGLPARLVVDTLMESGLVQAVVPCQIRRYTGVSETGETEILLPLDARRVKGETVVGVDDLVDGGQTLAAFRAHALAVGASEVEVAVIYAKPHSTEQPEYCAEDGIRQWLVLPGEEYAFMGELARTGEEFGQLSAIEQSAYLEALGLPAETVAHWARSRQVMLPGVQ